MNGRQIAVRMLLAAGLALTPAGCVVHVHESNASSYEPRSGTDLRLVVVAGDAARSDDARPDEPVVGTWRGEGRFVAAPPLKFVAYGLEIRESSPGGLSRQYQAASKDEIIGLPPSADGSDAPLRFSIRRDAGTLVFEGRRDGRSGEGAVRFRREDSYAVSAASLCGRELSTMELFSLASRGVSRADIDEFAAAGERLSPAQIVRLRDQGVTGAYVREITGAAPTGTRYSLDEIVRLRQHGVSSAYVRGLTDAGLRPSADEIVRLRNAGVSDEYVAELREPGTQPPEISDIIRMRHSGIRSSAITDLRRAGYTLSIDEAIRLHNHGVPTSYAKDIREAGYSPSADDLIRLRNSGVSARYVKDLQQPGQAPLSVDTIIDARNRGLSADFVKKLRGNSP